MLALVLGTAGSVLLQRRLLRWLRPGHEIGPQDRHTTLRLPARLVRLHGALWLVAVAALDLSRDLAGGLDLTGTVAAGGATTCALSYLLAGRVLRPLVAESMRGEREPPPVVLGVGCCCRGRPAPASRWPASPWRRCRTGGPSRLDIAVPVNDVSEVGQLRDLYGRQVGVDVARLSLERGAARR